MPQIVGLYCKGHILQSVMLIATTISSLPVNKKQVKQPAAVKSRFEDSLFFRSSSMSLTVRGSSWLPVCFSCRASELHCCIVVTELSNNKPKEVLLRHGATSWLHFYCHCSVNNHCCVFLGHIGSSSCQDSGTCSQRWWTFQHLAGWSFSDVRMCIFLVFYIIGLTNKIK